MVKDIVKQHLVKGASQKHLVKETAKRRLAKDVNHKHFRDYVSKVTSNRQRSGHNRSNTL